MIQDHRPFWLKRCAQIFERWYGRHFIAPQFTALGTTPDLMKPWYLRLYGANIRAGDFLHVVTAQDRRVCLSTWQFDEHQGHIDLGHYVLLCPGVRIDSASQITIGNNCMLAAGSYLTDADWHDLYDRTRPIGKTKPVLLCDNVWLGDGATVCKGVTIGENSIIGAGSVVATDIPANVIAAGNPAVVIRSLDPNQTLVRRETIFQDPTALAERTLGIDRYLLTPNSLLGWLRNKFNPRRGD
jgi:acetyltransferase-like isoleucine patch superfamily enzyme